MLTLSKQTNGNYHLGFANPADRKEFVEKYNLEKADALVHSKEWEQADWQNQQDLFQEALTGTGYSYGEHKYRDIYLVSDALENYFCNGFTNYTDDDSVAFDDGWCNNEYDEKTDEVKLNEYYKEYQSYTRNLIELLLLDKEIMFYHII